MFIYFGDSGPHITDWIEAVSSFLAMLVAVLSLIFAVLSWRRSQKAKTASDKAESTSHEAATIAATMANQRANSLLKEEDRTVWRISKSGRNKYRFTNDGAKIATVLSAEEVDLNDRPGDVLLLPGYADADIAPGQSFEVICEKSLASPAVAKVQVVWKEGTQEVKETFFVS